MNGRALAFFFLGFVTFSLLEGLYKLNEPSCNYNGR